MLIESFLRYIQYERNYSFHTVVSYKNDLFQFEGYARKETGAFMPESIQAPLIRSWVLELVGEGNTPRSVSRKISALRSFFKYLIKQEVISESPVRSLQLPKIRKKLPSFVRPKDMDLLIDDIDFGNGYRAVRDRLIIVLLYETGMRSAELIGLKDDEVDCDNLTLKVTGKRNKQRIIPFGRELKDLIEEYRIVRNTEITLPGDAFLLKEDGASLYPGLVYRVVTRYLSTVCTLSKKSPHVLRHTFASAMLNNGAELNSVKELLGHSSLASTEVYTHIAFEELKKSYKQAHPRAERKGGRYGS